MGRSDRGQVTIFVIVALIFVVGILAYFFFPRDVSFFSSKSEAPVEFVEKCISDAVSEIEDSLIESNFYLEGRENSILHLGEEVPYLCFVSEFYSSCTPQESALIPKLRNEIIEYVEPNFDSCLSSLKRDLNNKGYSVSENVGELSLKFQDTSITVIYDGSLNLEREGTSEVISGFESKVQSPLFNLAKTANDIVNFESTLCEFDYVAWMNNNRDVKISLFRAGDQSKIYTLTDRVSEKEIKFAVKTCVLPAGI